MLLALVALAGCGSDEGSKASADAERDEAANDGSTDVGATDGGSDAGDETGPIPPSISRAQEAAIGTISPRTMRDDVDFLADDALGGRLPASPGHRIAREYLVERMQEIGLTPFGDDGGYFHEYESDRVPRGDMMVDEEGRIVPQPPVGTGYNIVGLVPGSDPALAHEMLVLMAHYDHLGVEDDGTVFNGAFDNAAGVALALEVGRALLEAPPRRSVVILISDEEETRLNGAKNWISDPPVPPEDIVLGISGDPLGRRILPDYGVILLSGLERSPELLEFWRQTVDFAESDVFFVHRGAIPVFASDQDRFHAADMPIPAAWFINPGMSFYHTTDDTADTIDYRILLDSARYMARCLAFAGNTNMRWDYLGTPEIAADAMRDIRELPLGMLGSSVLAEHERERIEQIIADADMVIEADSIDVLGSANLWFVEAVGFIAFQLPRTHPGVLPPPFPGE